MTTVVTILRDLWRYRVVVVAFAVQSIAIALLVGYRATLPPESRGYTVGTATARVLVDTPASQVIEVAPKGSETLGPRATLLASLMAEGEVKVGIARRAGLRPDRLIAVAPVVVAPQTFTRRQLGDPDANLLTIRVVTNDAGAQLPIIEVEARARDAARAAALANAAVAGLGDYLASKAALENVPDARRLRVRRLGPAQAQELSRGPSPALALAAGLLVFGAECALLLTALSLAHGWRAASASERDGLPPETPGSHDDVLWDDRLDAQHAQPALSEPA